MAAHVGQRGAVAGSYQDVLDAAMPDMSLSLEENVFIEAVRRGDRRQVEEYVEKRRAAPQSSEAAAREFKLGSFALVLAAQTDNYDLVKFLISQGYLIEEPHPRSCACDSCNAMGSLEKALYRLNCYRALASPVYLSLAYLSQVDGEQSSAKCGDGEGETKDPVYQAFVLNGKLETLARDEYEFKNDYLHLSTRCEEYAVVLLNLCRNMKEIGCVMSMPFIKVLAHVQVRATNKEAKKLSVLNFAIKNKNERVS